MTLNKNTICNEQSLLLQNKIKELKKNDNKHLYLYNTRRRKNREKKKEQKKVQGLLSSSRSLVHIHIFLNIRVINKKKNRFPLV